MNLIFISWFTDFSYFTEVFFHIDMYSIYWVIFVNIVAGYG